MTNEEAREQIENLRAHCSNMLRHTFTDGEDIWGKDLEALDLAIKALEQEPRKDEVILTKKEYGELVSSEFDNGYAKGYREALEQEDILNKIRAEIKALSNANPSYWHCGDMVEREEVFDIIDKYRTDRS